LPDSMKPFPITQSDLWLPEHHFAGMLPLIGI
jgi:hypothetical protein